MQLRGYQSEAIANVAAAHRSGHQGVLLICPTGGGKTVIFSAITRGLVSAGRTTLIVVPSVELVEQTRDKLARLGIDRIGIIAAGWGGGYNPEPFARVQVATAQTLRSRPDAMLAEPDYMIFDEAHLSSAPTYRAIVERYSFARRLGPTATAKRLDGDGFLDMATTVVEACDVPDLLKLGALTPFRTRSIPMTRFSDAGERRREFSGREMERAFNEQALVGDVVEHYIGSDKVGRSGLFFGSGRGHAAAVCRRFVERGIRAEYLDGNTHDALRRAILRRLETGETTIVCNYGILTAGFDCPRIEWVGVGRATASWALWRQMGGRGLRPSRATGKIDCLIDDFGGNAIRHGNLAYRSLRCAECASSPAPCPACVDDILTGKRRADREDAPGAGMTCDGCRVVIDKGTPACPHCGRDYTAEAPSSRKSPGRDGGKGARGVKGTLAYIDSDEAPLTAEERAAKRAEQAGKYLRRERISKAVAFAAAWGRK